MYDLIRIQLGEVGSDTSKQTIRAELNSLLTKTQTGVLRPFALRLLVREGVLSRNYPSANTYLTELIKSYPNSVHELASLFDQLSYYVQVEHDLTKANMLLSRMKQVYPEHNLTVMARILMGEQVTRDELRAPQQRGASASLDSTLITQPVLVQNYPNPFNPSTTISFGVQAAGFTSLKVFDLLGREIAVLVNEQKEPGLYSVTWDASMMPSGMYFYRLETEGKSLVRKMALVR